MNARQGLIDIVNGNADGHQGSRQKYGAKMLIGAGPLPATWEEYEEQKRQGEWLPLSGKNCESFQIFDWVNPREAWLLTPEQAAQLGDVRGNEILLCCAAKQLLYDWGLIKLWGKAKIIR